MFLIFFELEVEPQTVDKMFNGKLGGMLSKADLDNAILNRNMMNLA